MTHHARRMLLTTAAGCLALTACGQSGPLYLPGNPSRIEVENAPVEEDAATGTGNESEPDRGG